MNTFLQSTSLFFFWHRPKGKDPPAQKSPLKESVTVNGHSNDTVEEAPDQFNGGAAIADMPVSD
jgi:hypothetical protein